MAYTAYEQLEPAEIISRVEKAYPGEGHLVERAYAFAERAHADQVRKSGEKYITHPLYVASILTDLIMDPPTIAAALLHDTLEDCAEVTADLLKAEFGEEVFNLVDGVTKLGRLDFSDREVQQAESLRKMIFAMSKDIRVVLIKLADRLHNMLTLRFQPADRQIAIARETLDIYAPLAHRLGVYSIKSELEDLSLRYLDPEGYKFVAQKVGMKRAEREQNIELVIRELRQKLDEAGLKYDIDGRPKHLYSIYRKMVIQNKPFEQIYDLIAIRVIVDAVPDCYTVLGIVHTLWNQVPGRFKDYISVPKANMYRSLHTTVIGGRKIPFPFEIQIRTWEMHRVAEYGIAAHWRYKEGKAVNDSFDEKLFWLRQILDWQSETRDSHEFIDSLKADLFSEEVFIFTPKGDIISMQRGATPLDFAYRIHSGVGNACTGAKVNGKMVPLGTELKTGDRVEIITSSSSKGPSMDWLGIVKTQQAKAKIRQFFKKELRGENVVKGRESLEREAHRRGVRLGELTKPEYYEPILKKYMFQDLDDLYGAIGYGGVAASYVLSRMIDEKQKRDEKMAPKLPPVVPESTVPAESGSPSHGVYVDGSPDMLVRFAHCCHPVPGDDIVGYTTRGRGVTVHKADCVNILNCEPERRIPVSWAASKSESFFSTIQIICYDHPSLLGELSVFFDEVKIPMRSMSVRMNKNKTVTITMSVEVIDKEQLVSAINKLRRRSDVIEAYRGKS